MEGWERRFAAYVHGFARADDLEEFRVAVCYGLRSVVAGDLAGYTEVDLARRRSSGVVDLPVDPGLIERFGQLAHQHPLVTHAPTGARTISDYLSVRRWHALELYADFYRHLGAEDQIAITLPALREGLAIGVSLNRSARTFDQRDRSILNTLHPLIVRSYQRALARERARALLSRLDAGGESPTGVIALDDRAGLEFVSERGREWLRTYFSHAGGASLPAELAEWLAAQPRDSPAQLTIPGNSGSLDLHVLPAGADEPRLIELRERQASDGATALTAREHQILSRLSIGETNQEIAASLGLSKRTVENHLQSIYRKLGVNSRTAAIAVSRRLAAPVAM